jgi:peptidoglycan pentaglycine glycine transferase (the first glycine)
MRPGFCPASFCVLVMKADLRKHAGRVIIHIMTQNISPHEDHVWDAFVANHPHGHILQTSQWARLKAAFGWSTDRAILREGPEADAPIRAGASLLFRRLPWGQAVAYAPKGPLVDWQDAQQVAELSAEMRRVCRRHRAALLKIEPELPASDNLGAHLTKLGYVISPQHVQPLSTIHLDLTADEETILARMKSKWRYNIRLAGRRGVSVREGDRSDLPAIQQLMDVTGDRDGFGVHNQDYYTIATELFVPDGLATWLIAEHEGVVLAAIAVFALGATACYMWGASADQGRNLMPNHALQWAAIQWAKARGCQTYDLWGIPDEVGDDPDAYADTGNWGKGGLWGVYRFKQGFGGEIRRYVGAWDLPLSAGGYALYKLALRVRGLGATDA